MIMLKILVLFVAALANVTFPEVEMSTYGMQKSTLPGPAARQDAFTILGPGGGGTMQIPTISPHDPNLIVEACDMTGAYITADGGQSWRMFNLHTGVRSFAFDPGAPNVIYAGNDLLWRSEDRGKTWSVVFPDPAKNLQEHHRGDHGDTTFSADDPLYPADGRGATIQAIAVDPANSKQIAMAFSAGRDPAWLYESDDGGVSWRRRTQFADQVIYALRIEPGASGAATVIRAIGREHVYEGAADHWETFPLPANAHAQFGCIGRSAATNRSLLYVTAPTSWRGETVEGGLYISEDGGRTWRTGLTGITDHLHTPGEGRPPVLHAIACAANAADTAYVGFTRLRQGEGLAGLYNGIARTTDGGRHWSIVHKESARLSDNLEGSWIEQRALEVSDHIWLDPPYSLGVAPNNADVCYATDLFRTYRTTDGGRNWQQVNSVSCGGDRWTTRGLDVTTCYGVHFDPFDVRHMFITYTDIGLFQSRDGGHSWSGATVGIPDHWRNTTYWIAFDPAIKGKIWGVFSYVHDLPRPKMWRNRSTETYRGGVAVSTDGGNHWTPSNAGMPETAATHILLDPQSPVGARTLYACGFGAGVYKSVDDGKSWTLKNNGIEQVHPFAWRLTRADNGALYLIVARRSEGGRIGDADDGALYMSIDGAEHWTSLSLPDGVNGPTGLTLDPRDNRRMYLTAWGKTTPGGDTGGGVYLSTDGGKHWKPLFTTSQHVYDLAVDPRHPDTLFICGFDAAAYRSTDAGATWSRIKGYNFKWGHRVIPDPVDPRQMYITTFGGSLWHGPAAGDPHALEDCVTPIRITP
jgi:photosystem II stability/assembly factor-like uncharacterized protein